MPRVLGDAWIVISPDTSAFGAITAAKVKAALAAINPTVKVNGDTGNAITAITNLRARLDALARNVASMRVGVTDQGALASIAGLQAKLLALARTVANLTINADTTKIDAQIAAVQAKLAALVLKSSDLQIDANDAKVFAKIAALQAKLAGLELQGSSLQLDANDARILAKIATVQAKLAGLELKSSDLQIDANDAKVIAKIATVQARLDTLKAEAADLELDANDAQAVYKIAAMELQLEGLLATLKQYQEALSEVDTANAAASTGRIKGRFASQSSISDLLAQATSSANLPSDAQLKALLAHIDAVEKELLVLNSTDWNIKIGADRTAVIRAIAATEADLAVLQSTAATIKMTADQTAIVKAIAATRAELDVLQSRAATIKLTADQTAIVKAIAATRAELDVLQSAAANIKMSADDTAIVTAIAATQVELDALIEKAKTLRLGIDVSGLAAAAAALGALELIAEKVNTSLGGTATGFGLLVQNMTPSFTAFSTFNAYANAAGGWLGALTRKVPLFGGALGGILPKMLQAVSVWHLTADVIVEVIAVWATAALAAGAFAIAASDAVREVTQRMKDLHTVSDATGKAVPPLTNAMEKLHKAVRPDVYQLFGDALNIINSPGHLGTFSALAKGAGQVVDNLAGRITVAVNSGSGFNKFTKNAVSNLAGLGNSFGNVFGAIGNVISVVPSYAEVLLGLGQAITGIVENATRALEPVLRWGLALHGAFIYIGVAVTAAVALAGPVVALGGAFLAAGTAVAEFIVAMIAAIKAGDLLTFAMIGLGEVDPLVWVGLAVAGLTALVLWFHSASSASRDFVNGQLKIADSAPITQSLTANLAAQKNVIDQLSAAQVKLGKTTEYTTAVSPRGGPAVKILTQAYVQQKASVDTLSSGLRQLQQQHSTEVSRLAPLVTAYGSTSAALGVLNSAGITTTKLATDQGQAWLIDLAQINGTIAGYQAMAGTAGELNNDLDVLGRTVTDQYTAVQNLNQAWSSFISDVTGTQTSFDTFATGLVTLSQAGLTAGSSLKSAQAAVAHWQSVVNNLSAPVPSTAGTPGTPATQVPTTTTTRVLSAAYTAALAAVRNINQLLRTNLVAGLTGTAAQITATIAKMMAAVSQELSTGLISKGQASGLTSYLKADNARLQVLAAQRAAIVKEISYANSVTTATLGTFSLTNTVGTTPTTAKGIVAALRQDISQINVFKKNIQKLAKLGLNKAYLDQIIQAGPVAGGQIAAELASGSWTQIRQVNSAAAAITSASKALGSTAANAVFGSGAQVGKGFLAGLESQQKSIDLAMTKLADAAIQALRKGLRTANPAPTYTLRVTTTLRSVAGTPAVAGVTGAAAGPSLALTSAQDHLAASQDNLTKIQQDGVPTIDGLNKASLALNQAFSGAVVNADKLFASWRTAGISGSQFDQGVRDTIIPLEKYARGSKEATAQLVGLAQEAGYHGPISLQEMNKYLHITSKELNNTQGATQGVKDITNQATAQVALLTGAMQAQGSFITSQLIGDINAAILSYDGVQKAATNYGTAIAHWGKGSDQANKAQLALVKTIVAAGSASGDSANQIAAMIAKITGDTMQQALVLMGRVGYSFTLTAAQARDAAAKIDSTFLSSLKKIGFNIPTDAVKKFSDAILSVSTTSDQKKAARDRLIADLVAAGVQGDVARKLVLGLQGQIDKLKGKTVNVGLKTTGSGQIVISGTGIVTRILNTKTGVSTGPGVTGGGAPGVPAAAAGWHVSGGTPGRDSVPVMAMPGELIVPTSMVKAGAVDHLRGKIPGFASGGIVGASSAAEAGVAMAEAQWGQAAATAFAQAVTKAAVQAVSGGGVPFTSGPAASGSAAAAQAFARSILPSGWSWPALLSLWNQESGWNDNAVNPTSGAYGIPQSLGHGHPYNLGDYANQIRWGINYISGRYGDSQTAWAHEVANNWYGKGGLVGGIYDKGGILPAGGWGFNGTGKAEMVTPNTGAGSLQEVAHLLRQNIAAVKENTRVTATTGPVVGQAIAGTARRGASRGYYGG